MIEAYQVGVTIAVGTNASTAVGQMAEQFEALDRVVKRVQMHVNELVGAMRGLGRVGDSAAASWRSAADAMQRAASAAKAASASMSGGSGRGAAAGGNNTGTGGSSGPSVAPYVVGGALASGGGSGAPRLPPNVRIGTGFSAALAPFAYPTALGGAGGSGGGSSGPGGGQWFTPNPNAPNASYGGYPLATTGGGAGGAGGGGRIPLNYTPPNGGSGGKFNAAKAGVVAYAGYETLRSMYGEAIDADSIVAQMRAQSAFTDKDVATSQTLARRLVSDVPGMGYAEALELILQTSSFTGDAGEALKLAPGLARNAQILSLFGKRDAITQVESGIKAGELTGLTDKEGKINTAKLMAFVNGLTNTVVSSGGTTDINKYLTSIRQFGAGADAASTDFLLNILPAYQKIMGESKAGTALQSFQQSLLSARPNTQNKAIVAEQKRLGIRGADGHLSDEDAALLSKDPNAFIVSRVLPSLYNVGYDTPEKIRAELPKFLPRNTMERLVAAGIFDEGVIAKEAQRNREQQAAGGPLGDRLLAESPTNQVKAFTEAFHLMQVSFGEAAMKPLTEAMHALADVFKRLDNWAKDNPGMAKDAIMGLAGAITFLGSAAILKMLSELGGGGGKLALLGAGIGILAGRIDGLPSWLVNLATGALVGGRVGGAPGAAAGAAAAGGTGILDWLDTKIAHAFGLKSVEEIQRQITDYRSKRSGDGPTGTAADPIHTTTTVVNGRDLARGVTDAQARGYARPSTGTSGPDPRFSPELGMMGVGP